MPNRLMLLFRHTAYYADKVLPALSLLQTMNLKLDGFLMRRVTRHVSSMTASSEHKFICPQVTSGVASFLFQCITAFIALYPVYVFGSVFFKRRWWNRRNLYLGCVSPYFFKALIILRVFFFHIFS